MDIFEYQNYKIFVKKYIRLLPKNGRGEFRRLAQFVGVNSTYISQIFNGDKLLNLEQGILVCEYFGLKSLEKDYFLVLVELERAGNKQLREHFIHKKNELQNQSRDLKNRIPAVFEFSEENKAVFYSDWLYSAISLLSSINGYNSIDQIANYFDVSRKRTNNIMDFLLKTGLCVDDKGKLRLGPSSIHLSSESPWINSLHRNWRLKALESLKTDNAGKLHYSSPMTLSISDAEKIRSKIVKMIEEVGKAVDASPSEGLFCLNVDWFTVK